MILMLPITKSVTIDLLFYRQKQNCDCKIKSEYLSIKYFYGFYKKYKYYLLNKF